MGKLAVLFAGQGAQYPGMGADWLEPSDSQEAMMRQASEIFGIDLSELLRNPGDRLNETRHAQPAIVIASLLAYGVLIRETGLQPAAMAGFSLGEYSALAASWIFSFSDTMRLLNARSQAMQAVCDSQSGKMAAVLGLPSETVELVCQTVSKPDSLLVCANYNCPGQIVVSGHADALDRAVEPLKTAGAKRVVPLSVSGAFHSPLMASALPAFRRVLDPLKPQESAIPVFANATAQPYKREEVKNLLCGQIVSPVRFEQTIRQMIQFGITHFLEIGPGSTLSSFVRRIDPSVQVMNLDKKAQMESVKGWLMDHGFGK